MARIKVQTRDLNVHYRRVHALKDVSIDIEANSVTAVIGPSGCGKTTFLRVLNRLVDLDGARVTGKVFLDGEDIFNGVDVTSLRRRVGMVFQQPNPFPMSIYDNVAFLSLIHISEPTRPY